MEINGKRYDAHTGAQLGHGHQPATPATRPAAHHVPIQTPKPVAHHKQAVRQPAKPASHHKQQRSTTLMRRAVRRPSASLKRHVKAQSYTGALVEQPAVEIFHSPSFGAADDKRLQRANHIKKSDLIKHFNPNQVAYQTSYKVSVTVNQHKPTTTPAPKPATKAVPRQPAPDIDDIFERAIQNATSHLEPSPKKAKKRRLHLSRKHARA